MIKLFTDLHLVNNQIVDSAVLKFLDDAIEPDDIVVILGDIFNSFNDGLKNDSFYAFLESKENTFYLLLGNHDISQGRYSIQKNVINRFSDRIKVINEYANFDIGNVTLHFYNYFRKGIIETKLFSIDESRQNILLTHMDLVPKQKYSFEKDFTKIISGHIHDFEEYGNKMVLGAVRQVAYNETVNKKYATIDETKTDFTFNLVDFESPFKIKKVSIDELSGVEIPGPTKLIVTVGPLDDIKKLDAKIKTMKWFNYEKVYIKYENYIPDEEIKQVLLSISKDKQMDILEIFNNYLDYYKKAYPNTVFDEPLYKQLFKTIHDKEFENLKNMFNIFNIQFKSMKAVNFKLFPTFEIDFTRYHGVLGILGENYDELDKSGDPSSNESGKSNIRNMIEFVLLGGDSKMKPLRWGTKSGNIELNFVINIDDITIRRSFTKSGNDLCILVNGEIPVEWKDETPTNIQAMFYEKYNISNALDYMFLSDNGMARYFFSGKNSEKFKMFQGIFPIIEKVTEFVELIKNSMKVKEVDKDLSVINYNTVIDKRKMMANQYKKESQNLWDQENVIEKELIIDLEDYTELKKEYKPELIEQKDNYYKIKSLMQNPNVMLVKQFANLKYDLTELFNKQDLVLTKIQKVESLGDEIRRQETTIADMKKTGDKNREEFKAVDVELSKLDPRAKDKTDFIKVQNAFKIVNIVNKSKEIGDLNSIGSSDLQHRYDTLSQEISFIKTQLESKRGHHATKQKEITELRNSLEIGSICNVCGSEIKNVKHLIEHIGKLEAENDLLKTEGKNLNNTRKVSQEQLDKIQLELDEELKVIGLFKTFVVNENIIFDNLKFWLNNINTYLDEIKGYGLEDINKLIEDQITFEQLDKKRNDITISLGNYQKHLENFIDNQDRIKKEIEIISNEIKDILTQHEKVTITDINNFCQKHGIQRFNIINGLNDYKQVLELGYKNITNEGYLEVCQLVNECDKMVRVSEKLINIGNQVKKQKDILLNYKKRKKDLLQEVMKYSHANNVKDVRNKKDIAQKEYDDIMGLYDVMTKKQKVNFKKFFINHFFSKFESIFNMLLTTLFDRSIHLEIDDMNFNFTDGINTDINFNDFSNGAKTKIMVSLMFSIQILFKQFGVNSNTIVIDEFLDQGIDGVNISRIFQLIKKFLSDKLVLVISHRSMEYDTFITVRRQMNESIFIG